MTQTGDSPETDSTDETATDGGEAVSDTTPEEGGRLQKQFERIRQRRRSRLVGRLVFVVFLVFVFLQALVAIQLFSSNLTWDFFTDSLAQFFPTSGSIGPIPILDVGEYGSFIWEENLIFDYGAVTTLVTDPASVLLSGTGIFSIFGEAGITLAMGVAGTMLGFPLALLLGVLGSERVMPFPFNFIFRSTMSMIRAIPALVWTLVFIALAGLTPVSATLAIAVDTIGNLGRLFVDELEEISDGPIEAMETTGASRPQTIVFGMLSQVRTAFIAWTLYIVEINVRIAVSVGVLGAGGIGEVVELQRGLRQFDNMMATLFCIFLLIITVELISQRLRARLRSDEEKRGFLELILGFPSRMARSVLK
jgi:phosphonate transport system permease protein